ncbi:rhomboid family intramembrane serine protease [Microbacterium esteraromaticum]|uniref:rhomboid family intramembrane serine protease n=1 Tax=Microbacterium esteraromaticum TaxID=57043 RepID=UPI0028F73EC9|nr:rhomboid family intramembrane serine protease [Microbacterium esteraromaticum]
MTASAPAPASPYFARFLAPVGLLALMWVIQLADAVLPGSFVGWGLRSWDLGSLQGVVLGPLLHAGWAHLIANSVPFLVLGCLVAVEGAKRFWAVTAMVALIGGAGTWLVNAPGTLTVGSSVLVFGYFGYVVVRVLAPGRLAHRFAYAAIAVIVVVMYGTTMFTGIFGVHSGVSWQAHLFGAIGGGLTVFVRRREVGSRE